MNPFRVILLVILSLSLAMMFYMVVFYLPQQKADYKVYQSMTQISHLQNRHQAHEDRMDRLAAKPAVTEENQLSLAQQEAQLAATEQQRLLIEAEERLVVAEARAREAQLAEQQQRQDREQQRIEREKSAAQAATGIGGPSIVIGDVHSYDAQWCILTVTPHSAEDLGELKSGQRLMVKRGEGLICEAVVESADTNAGLIIANVKQETLNPIANVLPEAGDKVVAITQRNAAVTWPDPTPAAQQALPQPPADQTNTAEDKELHEVELPLVPTTL